MDIIIWPITVGYSLVGLFILTLERVIETEVLIMCHVQLFGVAILRPKCTSKLRALTFTPIYSPKICIKNYSTDKWLLVW